MANLSNQELLNIINNLIIDKHIATKCNDFVAVCYNLFYNTEELDVTFQLDGVSYTIPNLAKNVGVIFIQGELEPNNNIQGVFGQIYHNTKEHKIYFKSTTDEDKFGWVELFQFIDTLSEKDTLDNITKLLLNTENIVSVYYDVFYNTDEKDVTLRLYDNDGNLNTVTIPNRAKAMMHGLSGFGSPEDYVDATLGRIYVDTLNNIVYIKTTDSGNSGWKEVLNLSNLDEHNIDPEAHEGYLAKIGGDATQTFNVSDPVAPNHAVNINYTGSLSNLNTNNKDTLVNSINEINNTVSQLNQDAENLNAMPGFSVTKGFVDSNGVADILAGLTDTIYVDQTTYSYIDNTNNITKGDNKNSSQDYFYWGNEGGVFGWPLGTGFHGWSKHVSSFGTVPYDIQTENVTEVVHEFSTPLSGGTYKFACSSNGYLYKLYATIDDNEVEITLPSDLNSSSWKFTDTFNVSSSISSIKAVAQNTSEGDWGIGAIHLIKVIAQDDSSRNNTLYFKVGPDYSSITCKKADGKPFVKHTLSPINVSTLVNGSYNVFVSEKGKSYLLDNTIIKAPTASTNNSGDIWVDTSTYPLKAKIFNENKWSSFNSPVYTISNGVNVDPEGMASSFQYPKCINFDFDNSLPNYTLEIKNIYVSSGYIFNSDESAFQLYFTGTGACQAQIHLEGGWESFDSVECGLNTSFDVILKYKSGKYTFGVKSSLVDKYNTVDLISNKILDTNKISISASSNDSDIFVDLKQITVSTETDGCIFDGSLPETIVPVGKVNITSGVITSVETYPYNNRKINVINNTMPAYVVDSDITGTGTSYKWYRKWSNGWIEQGGVASITTSGTNITLPLNFSNTNYMINTTCTSGYTTYSNKAVESFKLTGTANANCDWYVNGF